MTILPVVAAVLVDLDGRLLVQQRPAGRSLAGLWEFPGGKVEEGETPESALVRELNEELGITVDQACLAPVTFASTRLDDRHLVLLLYVCRKWSGTPRALEGGALQWVRVPELHRLAMPPADRAFPALLEALL